MIDDKISAVLESGGWYKFFAGNWSFLSLTHFAEQYTDILDLEGVKFCKNCVLVYRDGSSYGFIPEREKDEFFAYIADLYNNDPAKIDSLVANFRLQADVMIAYCKSMQGKKFDIEKYEDFWKRVDAYYAPHIVNKWTVESLSSDMREKYIDRLQGARLYAEPVFAHIEKLLREIVAQIANETGRNPILLLCISKAEILNYWRGIDLPEDSVLRKRGEGSIITRMFGVSTFFLGKEAQAIEEKVAPPVQNQGFIKGVTAYPGKAKGVVKIILDPTKGDHFQEGDILVTGMTRPEYLPLMKKASAFVTDSGGVLSHAAIVARELKKPCVISTQVATKTFHDGDMVEVDADKAIIRKI